MVKFLVDENLSPLIAAYLRKLGYQARAIRELHLTGKSDEAVLHFAEQKGWVIITGDVEFGKFFYERYGAQSIIILRSRLQSTGVVLKFINDLMRAKIFESLPSKGYLILADNKKIRVRKYI